VLETLNFYNERGDYKLIGFLVMPEHIHFICIPSKHISEIVRDIKKYVAKKVIEHFSKINQRLLIRFEVPRHGKRNHIYQIWQSDFYDFNITTEKKLFEKLKYMYENPIRKGLCGGVLEYKFSDAQRYFGSGDPKLPTGSGDPKPGLFGPGVYQFGDLERFNEKA
jgi:putative transposase